MSKNYNDCDIVFDLLPSYIEQKTCDDSNTYIQAHLSTCQACKKTFAFMQQDMPVLVGDKKKKRKRFWEKYRGWIYLGVFILIYIAVVIGIAAMAVYPLLFPAV